MSTDASSGTPAHGSSLSEWTLLVQQPGQVDQEVFVQHGLTIGRSPSNTIAVDHPDVERLHAQVQRQADGTLSIECRAEQARLTPADGVPITHVVLAPDVSFKIGPATITCRQRPTRSTIVVTQNPWRVRCPRCHAALGDLPTAIRQCPSCALPLAYFRSVTGFEGWLPLTVGPYHIRGFAAEGGMGIVLRGLHRQTDRPAAIKLMRLDGPEADNWQARFEREVETLKHLMHRHLVSLQDSGRDSHLIWLALDWVDGLPLSRLVATARAHGKGFTIGRIADLLGQLAAGLSYLHAQGVVHRDLKPSNVLVGPDGLVKLCDFGLAKVVGQPTVVTALTQTGTVAGTAGYMSPEQLDGTALTPASDVFSFGLLWQELLVGRRPAGATLAIGSVRPDCPPKWVALLDRCLALRPDRRPSLDEIRDVFWRLPTSVVAPVPRAPTTSATTAALPMPTAPAASRILVVPPVPAVLSAPADDNLRTGAGSAAVQAASTDPPTFDAACTPQTAGAPATRGRLLWWLGSCVLVVGAIGGWSWWSGWHPRDAQEQFELGDRYASGRGVPKDDAKAVEWFRKAAEQGSAAAQDVLGTAYSEGRGVPEDDAMAVEWYRKAAEQDFAKAQYNLGMMYRDGRGVPQSYVEAVKWFHKAAEQGSAEAQCKLGWMYGDGRGVPKDDAKAVKWFRKAAEQGDASAQYNLGWMYGDGHGVPKDDAKAVEWFRKAAEQGNAQAQWALGWMYENGRGVPENDVEAVEWYRKAAEQGDALAQRALGVMYWDGRGVPKDNAKAVEWFRKAAEQGNASAQYHLGLMYENGRGVPKDDAKAVEWFRKAAKQDDVDAQDALRKRGLSW